MAGLTLDIWESPDDIKTFNNERTIKLSFFHNTPEEEYYNMPLGRLRKILKEFAEDNQSNYPESHQENV